MSSHGLDLLLRVIAEQLREHRCEQCQRSLFGSRIALRESKQDQIVAEVSCRDCGHILLLQVKPEIDGIARTA